MNNNDQCLQDGACHCVKVNLNEHKMEKNKELLMSMSCSQCARWALDCDPQPSTVVRSLEGHRQLLQGIASRLDVPVPTALLSPADFPSHSNGEGHHSSGGGPNSGAAPTPCPLHVYRSYVALLRHHLEALRQLAKDAEPLLESTFDADAATEGGPRHDERSDDSGVSSSQSSTGFSSFLLAPATTKDTTGLEDQGSEDPVQSTDMEIKRTHGSADLDVKTYFKYERDLSLTALQEEVRRHREFLTQVWSQRRMPPPPWQCHSGTSESALSPFKGAARPIQITDQQLREGAEAVLRALDEALELSLAEEAEEKRRSDLSELDLDDVHQQCQELEDRHQQLQLENLQLRIQLQQRHAELQEERVRLQKQLEEEYRHHQQLQVEIQSQRSYMDQKSVTQPNQTSNPPSPQSFSRKVSSDKSSVNQESSPQKSQTFISLTNDSFTNGSSELMIEAEEEEVTVATPFQRLATRSYMEKSLSFPRKKEFCKDVKAVTTSEINQSIESKPLVSRTWASESYKRIEPKRSEMKGASSFIHTDTKRLDLDRQHSSRLADTKKIEVKQKRSRSKTEVKRYERKTLEKSPEPKPIKPRSWEKSPSGDDVQRKLRRKVRSQSVCLPYSHLSSILQAKITSVKRSLSAGAQNIQRALVALPRRILSNSSRIVTRVQNWFLLGERGFDITTDEGSIVSLPPTTRSRGPLTAGRSSPGRSSGTSIFGRGHYRNVSGMSMSTGGSPTGMSQSSYAVGSRPVSPTIPSSRQEALLTLRVEAPPASGRRLQRHLARLSEPEPKEMPALQVEVRLASGAALGPPVLLRQADAASFYASLLESSSALPPFSSPSAPANSVPSTPVASTRTAPSVSTSSLVVRPRHRGSAAASRLPWPTRGGRRGRASVRARRSVSQPTVIPPLPTSAAAAVSHMWHAGRVDGPLVEVWALYRRLWRMVQRLQERECTQEGVQRRRLRRPMSTPLPTLPLLRSDALLVDAVLDLSEGSSLTRRVLPAEEEEDDRARGEGRAGGWRGHGNLWLQGYLSLFALLCVLYPWPLSGAFDSHGEMQWGGGGSSVPEL